MRNRKQKSVLEQEGYEAGARLRNCMARSSRRRWRWESTVAADICRTGAGVTIAYGDADESVTINEREIKKD